MRWVRNGLVVAPLQWYFIVAQPSSAANEDISDSDDSWPTETRIDAEMFDFTTEGSTGGVSVDASAKPYLSRQRRRVDDKTFGFTVEDTEEGFSEHRRTERK